MAQAQIGSLLCRVLMLTSMALDSTNKVTIEFMTPHNNAPDGIAFCENNWSSSSTFSLQSLRQGGSQFAVPDMEVVMDTTNLLSNSFFSSSKTWNISTIKYLSAKDLVASDPFYVAPGSAARLSTAGWEALSTATTFNQQGRGPPLSLSSAAWHQGCFLITGGWKKHTKYQLTVTFTNPPISYTGPQTMPVLWAAPLSYTQQRDGKFRTSLRYSVRGSKSGTTCSMRPALAASKPQYFDACKEASAAGMAASSNMQACIQHLLGARASSTAAQAATFPLNQAPIVDLQQSIVAPAASCSGGSLPSTMVPEECVTCRGGAIQGGTCTCSSNVVTYLVGPDACGPPTSPTGQATSPAAVAAELCADAKLQYDGVLKGLLSDRVVAQQLLPAFARKAAFVLDWADIMSANESFWKTQQVDPRHPGAAYRNQGVAPNCNADCTGGQFTDIFSGKLAPVVDDRYQAVQTFRLIGYTLTSLGYECKSLYKSAGLSLTELYGKDTYSDKICNPLPS